MAEKPNILIAVPAYQGTIRRGCVNSILRLVNEFGRQKISFAYKDLDLSDVHVMRNVFASFLVQETQHTHMLFQDSDMTLLPNSVLRMILANKGVIACICPKRQLDINAALEAARGGDNNKTAIAKASGFNVRAHRLEVDPSGLVCLDKPEEGIGAGVMLIQRTALLQMIETGQVRKQTNHTHATSGLTSPLYGFFDTVFNGDNALAEDFSFCARYRKLSGNPVFALADEDIGHIGNFTYRAKITDKD